jgi:hypothetical protein
MERIMTLDALNLISVIINVVELLSFYWTVYRYIVFTILAELIISLNNRTFETHIEFITYFY